MLPSNAISVFPQYADYLSPDAVDNQSTQSFETGGTAINDASHGRLVQNWRFWWDAAGIYCSPIGGSPVTTLLAATGVTYVSGAWDSSMAPTICYIQSGALKLRWFNTVTHAFVIDDYSPATSGKVSTDDKRAGVEGQSDVIFGYTRGTGVYWRQERDRYTVEYTAGVIDAKRRLTRLGLTKNFRLQFELSIP